MKFDLEKTGLECVLRPWQAEAWHVLWEAGVSVTSSDVWKELARRGASTSGRGSGSRGGVSRASVINFLSDMADEGFLDYEEATGKGGYHRIYSPAECASNEGAFRYEVAKRVRAKVEEFLGE